MRTIEEIKGRCVVADEDGCWLWRGSVREDGRPNIYAPDHSRGSQMCTQNGPRAVWHVATGKAVPAGHRVFGCDQCAECCNPAHMKCLSEQQNSRRIRKSGRYKGQTKRILANRAINRRRALLTAEQVHYVLTSPKTGLALAQELGVSTTTISGYRRGEKVCVRPVGAMAVAMPW